VRDLEKRLERLEQALIPEKDVLVVAIVQYVSPGPITGWRGNNGFDCTRLPGESDDQLSERACAEARARLTPEAWGAIVLHSY